MFDLSSTQSKNSPILFESLSFPILSTFHFSVLHFQSIRISCIAFVFESQLHARIRICRESLFAARRRRRRRNSKQSLFRNDSKVISICALFSRETHEGFPGLKAVRFQLWRQSKRTTSINYSFNFVQTKAATYFP